LDDSVEVNGERLTDVLRSVIRSKLRGKISPRRLTAAEEHFTRIAFEHSYHPIKNYLNGLTWDGRDHIGRLAAYFTDKHGGNIFPMYLKRFCIGAVAKVYTGCQNPMLTLEGTQDIGKSFFVRWLCPVPNMYIDSPITDTKDCDIALISKWIWEVSEVDSTIRKTYRGTLKSFLSREQVTVRAPYGRYAIVKPALASFIATFNNESGILSDPTGNRRFHVVSLESINWAYATTIDVNSVWSQAKALYDAGETWKLSPDEKKLRDEINAEFEVESPVEDAILEFYEFTGNGNGWEASRNIFLTLRDEYSGKMKNSSDRQLSMEIASVLRKNGCTKYRFNTKHGWNGIKRKP
jgi:putative DNA primase/helicase